MSNKRGRPFKPWPAARLAAKEAGQTRYFDATPCRRGGHIAEHFTANAGCCACFNEKRGHAHTGPRVSPDLLTTIELAQRSELRQLANLKRRITDMQSNVAQRYAELRMSLSTEQSK